MVPVCDHVVASRNHVVHAPEHVVHAPDHVVASRNHVVHAPDHVVAVRNHVVPARNHVVAVPDHVVAVPDHVVAARDHVLPVRNHVVNCRDHVVKMKSDMAQKWKPLIFTLKPHLLTGNGQKETVGTVFAVSNLLCRKFCPDCLFINTGRREIGGRSKGQSNLVHGSRHLPFELKWANASVFNLIADIILTEG